MSKNNGGQGNHVVVNVDGNRLHLSHTMNFASTANNWRRHSTSIVANVGDGQKVTVTVYCNANTSQYCWHNYEGGYTALTIHRMPSDTVVGQWGPSAHGPAHRDGQYHYMPLDKEVFNSNSAYFTKLNSNTIKIHKEGWYRVDLRSISLHNAGAGNHFETWLNGKRLHLSHRMNMATTGGHAWRREEDSGGLDAPSASVLFLDCEHDCGLRLLAQ